MENLNLIFSQITEKRGVSVISRISSDEAPVSLDEIIIADLSRKCLELDFPFLQMNSGAGHDAMNMAKICPAGLIFVPSKGGISHHPVEYTSIDDIGVGATILEEVIIQWAIMH
jgi:N-carbamoyl-L-amino-acid hydrolase